MLAGERTKVPPKEYTLRRSRRNEDCKRTALWRRPFNGGRRGKARMRQSLRQKDRAAFFVPVRYVYVCLCDLFKVTFFII